LNKIKKQPTRTCLGCGGAFDKKSLVRIVRTPEGEVLVDPTGKRSGRGAYVCRDKACLEKAIKGKRLQRSLEKEIGPEIYEQLRESMEVQGGP